LKPVKQTRMRRRTRMKRAIMGRLKRMSFPRASCPVLKITSAGFRLVRSSPCPWRPRSMLRLRRLVSVGCMVGRQVRLVPLGMKRIAGWHALPPYYQRQRTLNFGL
jgi:hypothetical protein